MVKMESENIQWRKSPCTTLEKDYKVINHQPIQSLINLEIKILIFTEPSNSKD